MRCCLRDPTFSHFDTTPACDEQMDRHRAASFTALESVPRAKLGRVVSTKGHFRDRDGVRVRVSGPAD